ncbi:HRH3 protein, partial [Indicator maculatus]|nr:HRH3 protein [Indicator maculatus]
FSTGVFCMPLYIPYSLTGKWHLGRALCKLWLARDYLLCTASVFNIVLISYERFLSVTRAVSYRAQQGLASSPVVKMVAIWGLAFLLYCPAVLLWEQVDGHSVVAVDQCYAEFFDNWYFLLPASTLEFFLPLLLVTCFNVHIFHDIQRRQRHSTVRDPELPRSSSSLSCWLCLSPRPGASSPPALEAEDSASSSMRPKKEPLVGENSSPSGGDSVSPENDFPVPSGVRSRERLRRHRRMAKCLAVLVSVFAICWAPYTLLMITRGACQGTCVPSSLYEMTLWLLWLNSSLNPFLYPLCHIKF